MTRYSLIFTYGMPIIATTTIITTTIITTTMTLGPGGVNTFRASLTPPPQ